MDTIAQDGTIIKIATDAGLPQSAAEWLVDQFRPFVEQAAPLLESSRSIVVIDATQVSEMKAARTARIALGKIRVASDKHRKAIKEESLRTGQCIDAAHRWLADRISAEESRLEDAEKFAERAEAQRKSALKQSREILLAPFGTDTRFVNLADMPDDTFAAMLAQAKAAHDAATAAAAKAEADRVAAETARRAEEERMRIENARLKDEAEARDAAARVERERAAAEAKAAAEKARQEREAIEAEAAKVRAEAEAKLVAERKARQKLEQEAEARRAAEAKAEKDAEDARRRAAAAPDADKLRGFARAIGAVSVPGMSTEAGRIAIRALIERVNVLIDQIEAEAERISK